MGGILWPSGSAAVRTELTVLRDRQPQTVSVASSTNRGAGRWRKQRCLGARDLYCGHAHGCRACAVGGLVVNEHGSASGDAGAMFGCSCALRK
jgi:hypothetical protein